MKEKMRGHVKFLVELKIVVIYFQKMQYFMHDATPISCKVGYCRALLQVVGMPVNEEISSAMKRCVWRNVRKLDESAAAFFTVDELQELMQSLSRSENVY